MRKVVIIVTIITVLIIVGIYATLQIKYNTLEKSLSDHLISVEGYSESDIISIKAKLSSMPKFPVYVRFADDPDTDYIFTDRDASTWTQLDPKKPQRLKKGNN
ncbi:DUF3139 domain-containing protein [Paenibacillus glacialis]|uniref:DUF3139 domain-containing protein n=1 Tax=Paenibacillus glacialis TaxID=494026 RepID=A0A168DDQ3_9BACL|nr:DUF3139 domain-containing protein [Paenibacillus glacialis]OAB34105.1 hypothetical protein PGLA_24725 [Paenibacillus glacialis]